MDAHKHKHKHTNTCTHAATHAGTHAGMHAGTHTQVDLHFRDTDAGFPRRWSWQWHCYRVHHCTYPVPHMHGKLLKTNFVNTNLLILWGSLFIVSTFRPPVALRAFLLHLVVICNGSFIIHTRPSSQWGILIHWKAMIELGWWSFFLHFQLKHYWWTDRRT